MKKKRLLLSLLLLLPLTSCDVYLSGNNYERFSAKSESVEKITYKEATITHIHEYGVEKDLTKKEVVEQYVRDDEGNWKAKEGSTNFHKSMLTSVASNIVESKDATYKVGLFGNLKYQYISEGTSITSKDNREWNKYGYMTYYSYYSATKSTDDSGKTYYYVTVDTYKIEYKK